MVQTTRIALASLILLVGCAVDHQTESDSESVDAPPTTASSDPLNGEYPQIMWMCNVYEVPQGTEIGADGLVIATSKSKPNGLGVVAASNVTRAMDSIRSLPNARHLGTPVSFSPPSSPSRIERGTLDKAGSPMENRSLELSGRLQGESVITSAEITIFGGAFQTSCHCGARDVPKGGALLFLCNGSSTGSGDPSTLLVVRPTVLQSAADFPYQRANSFTTVK